MKLLESLVREILLTEEVFGAQAFVYHGSNTPPEEMKDILVSNKFDPGHGAGDYYGKGLYTVYESDPNSSTFTGLYGKYVYKLKVNLYGFIIFDKDICQKVYGKVMTPHEQLGLLGMPEVKKRIDFMISLRKSDPVLVALSDMMEKEPDKDKFTSGHADAISSTLSKTVKGIVFTGRIDGHVAVIYDTAGVVPVGWKTAKLTTEDMEAGYTIPKDVPFKPFDKKSLKPAISRSAMGDFTPGRFNP